MVARRGSIGYAGSSMNGQRAPPPGDHQGPPPIYPTALAPTVHPASCLSSWLNLTPIGRTLVVALLRSSGHHRYKLHAVSATVTSVEL